MFDETDSLFGAMYILAGYRDSVEFFDSIDDELQRLYGVPTLAEVRVPPAGDGTYTWEDIAAGDATLFSAWDTPVMTILHAAYRDDGEPGHMTHQVFYANPDILSAGDAYERIF